MSAGGFCECGCGQRTTVVRGIPRRFISGHNTRIVEPEREDENGCRIWQGATDKDGYGKGYINGRRGLAHRLIYEREVGPIPEGFHLHHRCEVPACVNPAHLEPLPVRAHMKTRNMARGERHGSVKLTEAAASQVRALFDQGFRRQDIADAFGLSKKTVERIGARTLWAHLPEVARG